MGAYQGKGAASYAASLVNLANAGTNDLTAVAGAPNWAAGTGWSGFQALGTGLDTGLIPANDQSWSVLIQFANHTRNTSRVLGAYTGAANQEFAILPVSGASYSYRNGGQFAPLGNVNNGNLGFAGNQGYLNGVADGGAIVAWGGASTFSVYIGALNFAGALLVETDGDVVASAFYRGGALSAPQMAAREAAMAAL